MIKKVVYSGFFIALALTLPMITGHIPEIGSMLSPMHIPVLLCGFICGPKYGALVGFASPLLKTAIFHMPPLYPVSMAMSIELLVYGLVCGLIYNKKSIKNIYFSLLISMVSGRVIYGTLMSVMLGVSGGTYTFNAFITGTVIGSLPGIILQILIVPVIVLIVDKNKVKAS